MASIVPSAESSSNGVLTNGNSTALPAKFDVVVVGAGLSGISVLYRLRKLNLKVKVLEAGSDLGGVWYWNRYPGARVDSEIPFYQLNIPEVYKTWNFTQRFPGGQELREYIAHIDRILNIKKDVSFNTRVNDVRYNAEDYTWTIKAESGLVVQAKYVVLATGLLNRSYSPEFPGIDKFNGQIYHSASWPEKTNCKGKRGAVIGSGATSIQIVQELAKETAEGGSLTVFVRRKSFSCAAR